jgi:hypothetical protein
VTTDSTFLRNPAYVDDESEVLISRSSWPLKLSGIAFGVLLVLGRSASYGNITWTPTYHSAGSPLIVLINSKPSPSPTVPKTLPSINAAAISKRSAATEVVTFSPGRNATDDGDGDASGSGNSDAGTVTGSNAGNTVSESTVQGSGSSMENGGTVTESTVQGSGTSMENGGTVTESTVQGSGTSMENGGTVTESTVAGSGTSMENGGTVTESTVAGSGTSMENGGTVTE